MSLESAVKSVIREAVGAIDLSGMTPVEVEVAAQLASSICGLGAHLHLVPGINQDKVIRTAIASYEAGAKELGMRDQ